MGKKNKENSFINKELWGMVLTLVSAVLFFCMITGDTVFYRFGEAVQKFMLGFFGYFGYPLALFGVLTGVMNIIGKHIVRGKGVTKAIALAIFLFCVFSVLQLATTGEIEEFYSYITRCYEAAAGGAGTATVGGVFFGLIVYPLKMCLSVYGAYILFGFIGLLCLLIVFKELIFRGAVKNQKSIENKVENSADVSSMGAEIGRGFQSDTARSADYGNGGTASGKGKKLVLGNSNFDLKTASDYSAMNARKRSDEILGVKNYGAEQGNSSMNSNGLFGGVKNEYDGYSGVYSSEYNKEYSDKSDYVKTPRRLNPDSKLGDYDKAAYGSASDRKSESIDNSIDEDNYKPNIYIPENYKDAIKKADFAGGAYNSDIGMQSDIERDIESEIMANNDASDSEIIDVSDSNNKSSFQTPHSNEENGVSGGFTRKTESVRPMQQDNPLTRGSQTKKNTDGLSDGEENPYDMMPLDFKYNPPPIELFKEYRSVEDYGAIEYFKQEKATKIMNTLKVLGGVNVRVVNIVHGPTITRFDLAIPDDVSIKNIMKYADDLKLRLETASEIRFATIPKTPFIGVEVPNDVKSTVGLRDVLESEVFVKAKSSSLTFAIGKNIVGDPVVADITKMPHLLIAGSTGTGKSVGLNALLVSLMYKYSPQELRFIIVDPKQVEFTIFEGIPHMYFDEILCDAPKTVAMLNWAVKEMEDRYTKLKNAVVRNIDEYNDQIDPRRERKMPRIVIIVDEFADLMSVEKKNIEDKIARIAQKARAAGMYLILATQRPDVKIIEGSIKTNFTSRMAFKMSNAIDSTTILGEAGAEKLLGAGDLLYKTSTMTNVERAQGAFISTEEIKNVVKYIKDHNKSYFNDAALRTITKDSAPQVESYNGKEGDLSSDAVPDDYIHALKVAVQMGTISISLLQRKLSFGYPKAAKIVDWMSDEGYIVTSQMGKQKQVTLTMDEFIEKFGDV